MAHSRADIMKAKAAYFAAANDLLSILAGEMAAIENGKRAVGMCSASEEQAETVVVAGGPNITPEMLGGQMPITRPERTTSERIKGLAQKMAGAA